MVIREAWRSSPHRWFRQLIAFGLPLGCSICVFDRWSFFAMLALLNSWCDALNCFVALGFGDRSVQPLLSLSSQIAATACGGGAIRRASVICLRWNGERYPASRN
ncbi:hypothetical protein SAMN05216228_1010178 [Rhizobium tibeticum]|uniref:Uncharacterized protein n=1 Tax=Rhizobium tibeticum TaxID=501024 RepID=A0ABY1ALN5_9HYPH|nr:hypothetical protein SAMN05216228_1010178 [Rhizobium tibeticum]